MACRKCGATTNLVVASGKNGKVYYRTWCKPCFNEYHRPIAQRSRERKRANRQCVVCGQPLPRWHWYYCGEDCRHVRKLERQREARKHGNTADRKRMRVKLLHLQQTVRAMRENAA